MHLSYVAAVGLTALTSYATAQENGLAFTTVQNDCQVGEPCTVEWEGAGGAPVEIILRQGDPRNLDQGEVLDPAAVGGSFTFIPSSDLAPGSDYAFEIRQGDVNNFSEQISVTGGNPDAGSEDDDDDDDDEIVGSQGLVSETETETETDTALVTDTETDTELVTDTATETETETDTDIALTTETETETETVETETETETETVETETETATETETELETETEIEVEDEDEDDEEPAEVSDGNAATRLSLSISALVGAVAALAYLL